MLFGLLLETEFNKLYTRGRLPRLNWACIYTSRVMVRNYSLLLNSTHDVVYYFFPETNWGFHFGVPLNLHFISDYYEVINHCSDHCWSYRPATLEYSWLQCNLLRTAQTFAKCRMYPLKESDLPRIPCPKWWWYCLGLAGPGCSVFVLPNPIGENSPGSAGRPTDLAQVSRPQVFFSDTDKSLPKI